MSELTYSLSDNQLMANGVPVLSLVGMSPEAQEVLRSEYQKTEDKASDPNLVLWNDVRTKRDSLLLASDWSQLLDAPLSLSERNEWSEYRQALRDIPQGFSNPDDIIWPEVPNG
jgi:hypothetical protein